MKLLLRIAFLAASARSIGPAYSVHELVPNTQYAEIRGLMVEAHAQDNHHAYPANQGGMQLARFVRAASEQVGVPARVS